jgi:hypothetical protein
MYFTGIHICLFSIFFAVFLVPTHALRADETYDVGTFITTATFRWNNENWQTEEHPKVATFTMRADGSAYGITETGVPFTQDNVENAYGIRIQRFEIQDHYHYVIDGEIAYTTAELSARLAQAYEVHVDSPAA